jgi:hypothetical protein
VALLANALRLENTTNGKLERRQKNQNKLNQALEIIERF